MVGMGFLSPTKAAHVVDVFRSIALIVGLVFLGVEFGVFAAVAMIVGLLFFDLVLYRPEWLRPGVFVFAIVAFVVGLLPREKPQPMSNFMKRQLR